MAQVKLNLRDLTIPEKIQKGRQIVTAMTGNANFTTPNPTLASITTKINTLETDFNSAKAKRDAAVTATDVQDNSETAFDLGVTSLGTYVENITGGDAVKIQSADMAVRDTPAPIGLLPKPEALAATIGDMEGECDLVWHRVKSAKSYIIQKSVDPPTSTSWQQAGVSTKSKFTVTGLTTGTKNWFRVAAVGSEGPGPWSDPAMSLAG